MANTTRFRPRLRYHQLRTNRPRIAQRSEWSSAQLFWSEDWLSSSLVVEAADKPSQVAHDVNMMSQKLLTIGKHFVYL